MIRDFTFIDDIVDGTFLCALKAPSIDLDLEYDSSDFVPNKVFNIGYGGPVDLNYFIELLEDAFSKKAIKKYEEIKAGDVERTFADTSKLENWIGYKPKVSIDKGVLQFANWYKKYIKGIL